MSDEQASSPSSAESVAALHTVRKPPAARINLCAFPAVPQDKRYEIVNQTVRWHWARPDLRHPQTPEGPPWFWTITARLSRLQPTITDTQIVANMR
jgi:hypothetical protein